jgi:acyl-CoA thioester hydrolase
MDLAPGEPRHDPADAPDEPVSRRLVWPFHPRFADLNAARHMDNVTVLRAVDEARHRLLGFGTEGGSVFGGGLLDRAPATVQPLVVGHRINYLRELTVAAEPLELTLWVCRLGRTSFDVATEVRQRAGGPLAAVAVSSLATVDVAAGRPWELAGEARDALAAYLGAVPTLR